MNHTFSNSNHNSREKLNAEFYIQDSLDDDTVEIEDQIEKKLMNKPKKQKMDKKNVYNVLCKPYMRYNQSI